MELKDFQTQGLSLDSFSGGQETNRVTLPEASLAQLAATEALQEPDTNEANYENLREGLRSREGRGSYLAAQRDKSQKNAEEMQGVFGDLIADGSIPLADQPSFVAGVRAAYEAPTTSNLDFLAEASLSAESREGATEQEEELRLSIADEFDEITQRKINQANMLNALRADKSGNLFDSAVDIVEMFVPFAEWIAVDNAYQEIVGDDDVIGDANLMGAQREALYSRLRDLPPEKRDELTLKMFDYINENDSLIIGSSNYLYAVDMLEGMLDGEGYNDGWEWFDNITSVLDVIGIGSMARYPKAVRTANKVRRAEETLEVSESARKTMQASVRSDTSPTSPVEIVKDTNPEKTRLMVKTIEQDDTGKAAESLAGTTREDAVGKAVLPEPEIKKGVVTNKVRINEPQFQEPANIRSMRKSDGRSNITEGEESNLRKNLWDRFSDVVGMTPVKEASSMKLLKSGALRINMMYRPTDSGFGSAEQARASAAMALRNTNVPEENISILVRRGENWVEVSDKMLEARKTLREELANKGENIPSKLKDDEFAIRVKYDYEDLDVNDVGKMEDLGIKSTLGFRFSNFFDRFPPLLARTGAGSVTEHLFPPNMRLHHQITNPASAAKDRTSQLKKAYLKLFEGFADKYLKFAKDRRAAIDEYIYEANFEGVKYNESNLISRGFSKSERAAIKAWRKANDAMFFATNDDMVKTLRNRGYKIYSHKSSDTKLVVQPVLRSKVNSNTRYYDPESGKFGKAESKEELDKFYEQGGSYAKLSEPLEHDGMLIEYVRSTETPQGGYIRNIKDGETVLHYRDGYYPVMYDANYFISRTFRDDTGKEITKVIGSAQTKEDAEALIKMEKAANPKSTFDYRPDRRLDQDRSSSFDSMSWSLSVNSGLSSQRIRGKRLADATTNHEKFDKAQLVNPLKAVERQVGYLADKVSMRNYFDSMKKRWVDTYKDVLDLPEDAQGIGKFPANITGIKSKGGTSGQLLADAREMYNYIYHLENGFANHIDEAFKGAMNLLGESLAELKLFRTSDFVKAWGGKGLTGDAKAATFKMYLATNPARQLLIQSHQSVQLAAVNPTYMPQLGIDLFRIGAVARGNKADKEAVEMWEEFLKSGQYDAVDENNLVRSDRLQMAYITNLQKLGKTLNVPIDAMQKIGFDTGERLVLLTSWLTHRDLAIKAGKTLDARTYEEIAGQARAYTYNMNQAGEMPYNQNALNVIAQFLQVPHKAVMQPFMDKSLSTRQRSQLLAWNTVTYGVPTVTLPYLYSFVEPGPERDLIERGLEHVLLNEVFSQLTGEEQQIDWSDFTPTDVQGMGEFTLALLTGDLSTMVSEAPATGLLFGQNPRVTNLVKTMARWTHLADDYDDPELDTKFSDVATAFLSLSSGFSNGFKAAYAYESKRKMSSLGNLSDEDVTSFEAALQAFGFETLTQTGDRAAKKILYGESTFNSSDVELWYNELKRQLARRGESVNSNGDLAQRILTEGLRVFESDPPGFKDELHRLIKRDFERSGTDIFELIRRDADMMTKQELLEVVDRLAPSPERDRFRAQIETLGRN